MDNTLIEIDEKDLICPITRMIFNEPVMATDGYFYERQKIEAWLEGNNTSPMTGMQLESKNLYSNIIFQNIVDTYIMKYPLRKQDQYIPIPTHRYNRRKINSLIQKKEFHLLYEYSEFSIEFDKLILTVFEKCGDNKVLIHVFNNIIDPNYSDGNSRLLMDCLISNKRTKIMKLALLNENIDISDLTMDKICSNFTLDILRLALNRGITINPTDVFANNCSLLHCVIVDNENRIEGEKIIDYLLSNYCFDMNYKCYSHRQTYLHVVAQYSTVNVLKMFIAKGCDPYANTLMGDQIIHYAVYNNSIDMIKYIMELGFSLETINYMGCRAIDFACYSGNFETINFLLDQGVCLFYDKYYVMKENIASGILKNYEDTKKYCYKSLASFVSKNEELTSAEKHQIMERLNNKN
jgi:hypothetical protein